VGSVFGSINSEAERFIITGMLSFLTQAVTRNP
jgi:hypothetical protein